MNNDNNEINRIMKSNDNSNNDNDNKMNNNDECINEIK